jgi:hypothetical protein
MPDIVPTPQSLPTDFCPTDWQTTLDEFAASMIVTIPSSFGQIIISDTTPAPADNAKIWFKVDANNHVVGVYSYSSLLGGWQLIADYPYYFQDVGSADAIAITTGENIALNADIQGRFFFVCIAATNLTTAPTFDVDIAPVTAIRKYGTDAIAVGDFQAGMIAILLFDGTQYQFLNPKPTTVEPSSACQFAYQEPSGTAAQVINAGDTTVPLNTSIATATWASLDTGTNAVTILEEGNYWIQGSVYLVDVGGTAIGGCQIALLNGVLDLNWQDGTINNVDDTAQMSVSCPITVAPAGTAVITFQIRFPIAAQGYYGVDTTSARAERPASLSIIKLS